MVFQRVISSDDLSSVVQVLNVSHGTVAKDFGFTRETNPTNNAFIDESTLKSQLIKGIELYTLSPDGKTVGCIAIEKSSKEADTFYIEKVSVVPEFRNQGFGIKLMDFATSRIKESGGKIISIALIDSNAPLKNWYIKQGFKETGTRDFDHLPFSVCFMNKLV
ncbi:MAG: GNAT family N-acetyltransferase [Bacteroidales bacterium]|nr:GNAT family N-acetyltransferase [Bacteroidales bacterium]